MESEMRAGLHVQALSKIQSRVIHISLGKLVLLCMYAPY